jgi:hypothetical protein
MHAYKDSDHGVTVETTTPQPNTYAVKITLASSGHGSLGGVSALAVAASGFYGLGILKLEPFKAPSRDFFAYQRTPGIDAFVKSIGKLYHIPSFAIAFAEQIGFIEQKFLKSLGSAVYSERLFRSSCSWTALNYKDGQSAEALSDCRLIHTGMVKPEPKAHGDFFRDQVKAAINDPELEVTVQNGWNFAGSPGGDHPLFKALTGALRKEYPNAIISEFLAPTSSDSAWLRAPAQSGSTLAPVPSYGFYPVVLAEDLAGTIHGSNERMPLSQVGTATRIYLEAMRALAQSQ